MTKPNTKVNTLNFEKWEKIHSADNQTSSGHYKVLIMWLPALANTLMQKEIKTKQLDTFHFHVHGLALKGYHFIASLEVDGTKLGLKQMEANLNALVQEIEIPPIGHEYYKEGVTVSFENCVFDTLLSIESNTLPKINSRVSRLASFYNCDFQKKIIIDFSKEERSVWFLECNIRELIIFATKCNDEISTAESLIAANVGSKIAFRKGVIGQLYFQRNQSLFAFDSALDFHSVSISYMEFNGVTFLSKLEFDSCDFEHNLNLYNSEISPYTTFLNSKFEPNNVNLIFFRQLKRQMRELGNDHDAHIFASLELEARKEALKNKSIYQSERIELFMATCYKRFSDFGRNLFTPLSWLVFLWIIGGILEYRLGFFNLSTHDIDQVWAKLYESSELLFSFLYSLKLTLGPFGIFLPSEGVKRAHIYAAILAPAHQIIATVMWFLYLLQIRKRFILT